MGASDCSPIAPSRYLLLDANILAGFYAPETLRKHQGEAGPRIKSIIDFVCERVYDRPPPACP